MRLPLPPPRIPLTCQPVLSCTLVSCLFAYFFFEMPAHKRTTGDVVICTRPVDPAESIIKRVVAMEVRRGRRGGGEVGGGRQAAINIPSQGRLSEREEELVKGSAKPLQSLRTP